MSKVDSHLQPRFFLKGFAAPKEQSNHDDSVYVYRKGLPFKIDGKRSEKNPARTGINNTALVTNFYGFRKKDGTFDAETYENRLERDLESPGNAVLRKLRGLQLAKNETIKVGDFLSSDERRDFARYVISMYARTKRSREDHSFAVDKSVISGKEVGVSYADIMAATDIPEEEKEKFDRNILSVNPGFDRSVGRITLPPKFMEGFREEMENNESFAESIFRAAAHAEPFFLKMKWQFHFSANPHAFFTGDDPVTWNNLKSPNAVVLFPISSNAVFFGFNNQNNPERIIEQKDNDVIIAIRTVFAEKCKELYYSKQAEWLVNFFNKRQFVKMERR